MNRKTVKNIEYNERDKAALYFVVTFYMTAKDGSQLRNERVIDE
jgi:hypothetical protein